MGNLVTFMAPLVFAPGVVKPQHLDYGVCSAPRRFPVLISQHSQILPCHAFLAVEPSRYSAHVYLLAPPRLFLLCTLKAHEREGVAAQTSLRLPVSKSVLISLTFWAIRFGRCVGYSQTGTSDCIQLFTLLQLFNLKISVSTHMHRVISLFFMQKKSREESCGEGSGVEILENKPYTDGPGGSGQYTHKVYHIGMHIPSWFRSILPKAALRVEEESWNAYPYTRTR